MNRSIFTIFAAVVCAISFSSKALNLPPIIGDHMVLQQSTKANVWGWAKPGSIVKVTNSWNKDKLTTKAGTDGKWIAALSTPAGSYEPQTITIEADGQKVTLTDVLIGEVWLASGQSNMEFPLKGISAQHIEGAGEELAYADELQAHIRMANTAHIPADAPVDSVKGSWKACTRLNAPDFSAVAYFFAKALNRVLQVPIGIIHSSWGGTALESWVSHETLAKCDTAIVNNVRKNHLPVAGCFYGMMHPYKNYTLRGFIWNQGETNAMFNDTRYAEHFAMMARDWRTLFGQGQLPIYCVEIPGYEYDGVDKLQAPKLREQQWRGCELAGNADCVSIIDLMHPWQAREIHGSLKKPIGDRLAWLAADRTYGIKGLPATYPKFDKVEYRNDTAFVTFKNAPIALGCVDTDGTIGENYVGFEVAGADKEFYPAKGKLMGWDSPIIALTCDKVKKIEAVRYCFRNWTIGKVKNTLGLPLVPFRSDNW